MSEKGTLILSILNGLALNIPVFFTIGNTYTNFFATPQTLQWKVTAEIRLRSCTTKVEVVDNELTSALKNIILKLKEIQDKDHLLWNESDYTPINLFSDGD